MRRALLFGPVIRNRRHELELTMDAFCRKVVLRGKSISKGYLSGIENSKTAPPTDAIVLKFARALDIPSERLLLLAHIDKLPAVLFESYPALCALRDEASRSDGAKTPTQVSLVPTGT